MKTDSTDNHDESAAERVETDQWTILGDGQITKDECIDAKTTKLSSETTCDSQLFCKTFSEPKMDIPKLLLACFVVLAFVFFMNRPQVGKISSLEKRIKDLESEKLALTVEAKRLVELPRAEQYHFQSQNRVVEKGLVEQNAEWTGATEIPEHVPKQLVRENNFDDSDNNAQQIESQRKNNIDKDDEEATTAFCIERLMKEGGKYTELPRFNVYRFLIILGSFFILYTLFLTLMELMKILKKKYDIVANGNADTHNADSDTHNADSDTDNDDNDVVDDDANDNDATDDDAVDDAENDYELIMTMLQNAQKLIECHRETFKNTKAQILIEYHGNTFENSIPEVQ